MTFWLHHQKYYSPYSWTLLGYDHHALTWLRNHTFRGYVLKTSFVLDQTAKRQNTQSNSILGHSKNAHLFQPGSWVTMIIWMNWTHLMLHQSSTLSTPCNRLPGAQDPRYGSFRTWKNFKAQQSAFQWMPGKEKPIFLRNQAYHRVFLYSFPGVVTIVLAVGIQPRGENP